MSCKEEFYTYIYYDPSRSNEPFYVGKGISERAWSHLYRKGIHPFIQRLQYMKKNNINPIIGIYAKLDEEFAHLLEMELISKFGRKDLGLGPLLNLSDGGEGNGNRSDEYKKKMSESKKGSIPWNLGIPLSTETKEKISGILSGRKLPEETKMKMSNASIGKSKTKEHNKNVSIAKTGKNRKPFSEEWRQKMSISHKIRWAKIKENKDIK